MINQAIQWRNKFKETWCSQEEVLGTALLWETLECFYFHILAEKRF